jgi:quercetin dioxygenase-like cupin family protein
MTALKKGLNALFQGGTVENESAAPTVMSLETLISYQEGSIVSRQIIKKETGNITLFAFAVGQGLTEHTSSFDALVQVLEGEAEVTISKKPFRLKAGDVILMPAQHPHALKAVKPFKMMLTMIRA